MISEEIKKMLQEWKVFTHTSPLGDTGDYMSEVGIENGNYKLFCSDEDIETEELQEMCDKLNNPSKYLKCLSWVSIEDKTYREENQVDDLPEYGWIGTVKYLHGIIKTRTAQYIGLCNGKPRFINKSDDYEYLIGGVTHWLSESPRPIKKNK